MMSASTASGGGWSCTPTAPPPPTGPRARCYIVTARRVRVHQALRRPEAPPGTTNQQGTARDREATDPGRGHRHARDQLEGVAARRVSRARRRYACSAALLVLA